MKIKQYTLSTFLIELLLLCLFLLLQQTVVGGFFPSFRWLAVLPLATAAYAAVYAAGYNKMLQQSQRHLLLYIMVGKVLRMIFFAVIFLIYAMVDHTHVKGYAVAVVVAALLYLAFDAVYMVKKRHKQTNQAN